MKKIFIFSLVFLISYGNLQSQESMPRVGIGLSVSDIRKYVNIKYNEIAHNIYIPINIGKSFRLEPQLGFDSYLEDGQYSKSRTSYFQLGVGVFTILSRNKTILYFGGRLCFLLSSQTYTRKITGITNKESDIGFLFIAPAIGGEYFVCEELSLGGEMQLKLLNYFENTKRYFTNTLLFMRFYL
ncbi:hypothetical protein JW824_14430 [bacterium]|nr:hypothetical protein [bacterium]